MGFLDEKYLLQSPEAMQLYELVKELPIIDAHNHGDVPEIVENKGWNDIWEVEAATDHYVWELMRKRGVPEQRITGEASNRDKWMALASVLPECGGNAVYEWIHLDLKRRFGISEPLSAENAEDVWEKTRDRLQRDDMKPQALLKEMKVEIMCTTDEPDSLLESHKEAAEQVEGVRILPTWRPDKIMNIHKSGWREAVESLGRSTGAGVRKLTGLLDALKQSHSDFDKQGCVASDHGVLEPISRPVSRRRASDIYDKALSGKGLNKDEISDFQAFMMFQFGELNRERDWVTQIHMGVIRDYRDQLFDNLGPDSGGDISTNAIEIADNLRYFLNSFGEEVKVVLYCLDPGHLPTLASIARAFPGVSLGAPWWLNDSPFGMEQHLRYVATVDLLFNHAGMVTDSRKLLSYGSRTEMFRRVLCNVVGDMLVKGQIPESVAAAIAKHLSYQRPKSLFFE